jgi:hypothetical protein
MGKGPDGANREGWEGERGGWIAFQAFFDVGASES